MTPSVCISVHTVSNKCRRKPLPSTYQNVALVGWNHHVGSKKRGLPKHAYVQTTRSAPVSDPTWGERDVFLMSSRGCSRVSSVHAHKSRRSETRLMCVILFNFQGGVPEQILQRDGLQALPLLLQSPDPRLRAHLTLWVRFPPEGVRPSDPSRSSRTHFSIRLSHNDSRFLMFICNLVSRNYLVCGLDCSLTSVGAQCR